MPGTSTSFFESYSAARVASLLDLLELRAGEDHDFKAYRFLGDEGAEQSHLSYAELFVQAKCIASEMMEYAAEGSRALLFYGPGLDFLSAFFGCICAKVIAVPAYPPHRNRNILRIEAIIRDSQPALILTTSVILPRVKNALAGLRESGNIRLMATDEVLASGYGKYRRPKIDSDAIAFLQYTSGSTGDPKGVMLSHGNLLHNAAVVHRALEHTPSDSYVSWLPVFHDMGFMAGVLQPLYAGIPTTQMAPAAFLEQPVRWLKAISEYRATTSGAPNFAYELCVRKIPESERNGLNLRSWSVAFNGAEPVRWETMKCFADAFGISGFSPDSFFPCYGLAESTLMVTASGKSGGVTVGEFEKGELGRQRVRERQNVSANCLPLVSSGGAIDQTVVIVDPESQQLCARNQIGEIWVKGASVAQGYWNRPQESQETFGAYIQGISAEPFLRTGDLGFVRHGQLFVAGRLKDLLIIRGKNHYPQDIELSVEKCDSSLRPGCGAAFSIDMQGEERLVVVQECATQRGGDMEATIAAIRRSLAENHELAPYAIKLIRAGTIPKTSSGKIQRRACKAAFLSDSLQDVKEWRATGEVEFSFLQEEAASCVNHPRANETQRMGVAECLITEIARRKGIDPSQVNLTVPITAYGLDSLAAVELAHVVQLRCGIELQAADILEGWAIADIVGRESHACTFPQAVRGSDASQPNQGLSSGQKAIWFLNQLALDSPAYNISRALRIKSLLDLDALKDSFQALVNRHASLRATFPSIGGEPVQAIAQEGASALHFVHHNASGWTDSDLRGRIEKESQNPFDLSRGPLLRINIYSKSSESHVLQLTVHHIVADLWSLMLLLDELGMFYESRVAGIECALPLPACDYSNFVNWQHHELLSVEGERHWSFWRGELPHEVAPLQLPTDFPRPPLQTFCGASESFCLDADLSRRLRRLAMDSDTTVFTVLLATFQVLLHRLTAQEEVVVGAPTAGRPLAQFAEVVGYCVNPVVLKADFRAQETFSTFLQKARNTVLNALAHASYPFPLMVEKLGFPRDPRCSPIFQAMFAFQKAYGNFPQEFLPFALGETGAEMKLGQLHIEPFSFDEQIAPFDLTLMAGEGKEGISGAWQYNSDLFRRETITRWSDCFQALLEEIACNSNLLVSELPLVSRQERKRLIEDFGRTEPEKESTPRECLHEVFEKQVRLTPERIAILYQGQGISYHELNSEANCLARNLIKLGAGPQDRVAICMSRTPSMIAIMLAVWKIGGAYVPLDPQYPDERLQFMMQDSRARLVITESGLRNRLGYASTQIACLDELRQELGRQDQGDLARGTDPGQMAYLIYTSGSTGVPKGVMLEHRSAMAMVNWGHYAFDPQELSGVLAATSICFDLSIFELWVPLTCGGTVVLVDDILSWWESDRDRTEENVTLINTVPSAMARIINRRQLPDSVRTVNLAGEALGRELVDVIYGVGSVARVNNLYGPTETTTYSTWTMVKEKTGVTIGRPIVNTQLYILDGRMGLAPVGITGELYIAGAGVARGYWNRSALTAECFLPDPYSRFAGARMYRTGDLVKWRSDGQLEYLGRKDSQLKIRGYRIELGEIESVLRGFEEIEECVVSYREHTGEKQLFICAVAKPGTEVSEEEIKTRLQRKLPSYMVPAHVMFLARLPRLANGKIDRKTLPLPEAIHKAPVSQRAQTPTEKDIAEIWQQTLGIEVVGTQENFFALGGHSLLATQVMAKVEEHFKVTVQLHRFVENPTVAAIAQEIESGRARPVLPRIKRLARSPGSFPGAVVQVAKVLE